MYVFEVLYVENLDQDNEKVIQSQVVKMCDEHMEALFNADQLEDIHGNRETVLPRLGKSKISIVYNLIDW